MRLTCLVVGSAPDAAFVIDGVTPGMSVSDMRVRAAAASGIPASSLRLFKFVASPHQDAAAADANDKRASSSSSTFGIPLFDPRLDPASLLPVIAAADAGCPDAAALSAALFPDSVELLANPLLPVGAELPALFARTRAKMPPDAVAPAAVQLLIVIDRRLMDAMAGADFLPPSYRDVRAFPSLRSPNWQQPPSQPSPSADPVPPLRRDATRRTSYLASAGQLGTTGQLFANQHGDGNQATPESSKPDSHPGVQRAAPVPDIRSLAIQQTAGTERGRVAPARRNLTAAPAQTTEGFGLAPSANVPSGGLRQTETALAVDGAKIPSAGNETRDGAKSKRKAAAIGITVFVVLVAAGGAVGVTLYLTSRSRNSVSADNGISSVNLSLPFGVKNYDQSFCLDIATTRHMSPCPKQPLVGRTTTFLQDSTTLHWSSSSSCIAENSATGIVLALNSTTGLQFPYQPYHNISADPCSAETALPLTLNDVNIVDGRGNCLTSLLLNNDPVAAIMACQSASDANNDTQNRIVTAQTWYPFN